MSIHGVFREVLAAEKFLLQVLDVPCLIEIVHFLAKLADRIACIAVRMRVVDAEKDFLHGYIVIDEAFKPNQLRDEKAHLILIFSRCQEEEDGVQVAFSGMTPLPRRYVAKILAWMPKSSYCPDSALMPGVVKRSLHGSTRYWPGP